MATFSIPFLFKGTNIHEGHININEDHISTREQKIISVGECWQLLELPIRQLKIDFDKDMVRNGLPMAMDVHSSRKQF